MLTFSRYQPGSIIDTVSRYYSREIDRVICVHTYGKVYLTPSEFERCMSRAWRVYYEGLGRQWLRDRFRGTSQDFWDFHRKRLSSVGLKIEPTRLAVGVFGALLRTVGSPFDLVREIVRSRRPVEDPWRA